MSDLTPTNLLELAARVEGGEGEDRDLDIAIWRLFEHKAPDNRVPLPWLHCYTSSIDAVTALLERVLPGWEWQANGKKANRTNCLAWVHSGSQHDKLNKAEAASPARALLAATLRALETLLGAACVWTHHEANGSWFWRLGTIASGTEANEADAKKMLWLTYEARILSALEPRPLLPDTHKTDEASR